MSDTKKPSTEKPEVKKEQQPNAKDKPISDKELDDVAGGQRKQTGGYGTLDYGSMTSHGGD